MIDTKEKKFYWSSGVTRQEVVGMLNDEKPSVFRNQLNRRLLTLVTLICLVCMSLTVFVVQPKLKSYLDIVLLTASLFLYFQLRKAVRSVADAPDDLLDERQIAIRNSAYLIAYRWLAGIFMCHVFVFLLVVKVLQIQVDWESLTQLFIAIFMWIACLPSMALAWRLPSEVQFLEDSK